MYKHAALLVRRTGTSHDEFHERWLEKHVPLAREIDGLVRYHTVVPADPETAEFDGIAELYFESLDALRAALGPPGSRDYDPTGAAGPEASEDVDDFLAVERCPRFVGAEVVQKDETEAGGDDAAGYGDTDGLYKHSAFLVRKAGMSHDEFRDYWENRHTPLARDIEGVVRYHTVYPTDPEAAEFDGVAELYFETLAELHDALGSPGSRDYDPTKAIAAKAREDVDNFLAVERRPRLIGREAVQKDETGVGGY